MIEGQTRRSAAYWRRAAAKASETSISNHRDFEADHFIYRCYDADGVLLYIGCTMDVETRMEVHRSSWENPASAYLNLHMARYEVSEPIKGRIAGRKAEREAIAAEAPLLNVHHNKGRGLPRADVEPLQEGDLAEAGRKIDALLGGALSKFGESE